MNSSEPNRYPQPKLLRELPWSFTVAAIIAGLGLPSAALAQDSGSSLINLLAIALAIVAVLVSGASFLNSRRLSGQQTEEIEVLARERDEAKAALAKTTRELEVQLGEQITELENENDLLNEATAKLRKLVVVDELTSLANRMHFDQVLPHEIKRALREEKSLSVILARFDWSDGFLQSYGPERFDEAIARIAEEVKTIFRRAGDLPARYSDNTFGVIFTSDGDVAMRFADRLRKTVWNIPIPHESSQTADRVTISVGVATIMPNKVHDPAEFRRAAENAVRVSETKGGNCVEEYRRPPEQPAAI